MSSRITRSQSILHAQMLDGGSRRPRTRSITNIENDHARATTATGTPAHSRKRKTLALDADTLLERDRRKSKRQPASMSDDAPKEHPKPLKRRRRDITTASQRNSPGPNSSRPSTSKARRKSESSYGSRKRVVYVELPAMRVVPPIQTARSSKHNTSSLDETDAIEPGRQNPTQEAFALLKSVRLQQKEVYKQQETLMKQQQAFSVMQTNLSKFKESLDQEKAELTNLKSRLQRIRQEEIITEMNDVCALLEEHCQCAICHDVVAAPHTLFAYKCGHSFCALCLLQWACSLMHECGSWHSAITCPSCRSSAPIPPALYHYGTTRPVETCPFVVNRSLNDLLEVLVQKLYTMGNELKKLTERSQQGNEITPLLMWAKRGETRRAWNLRKERGNHEMTSLLDHWATISFPDLLALKLRVREYD